MSVDMSVIGVHCNTPGAQFLLPNRGHFRCSQNSLFSELELVIHKPGELLYDTNPINQHFLRCILRIRNQITQLNIRVQVVSRWLVSMNLASLQLLTIPQAASILAVSPSTIKRLLAKGDIEYTRVQRAVRIRQEALEAYVDRNTSYVGIRRGSNS